MRHRTRAERQRRRLRVGFGVDQIRFVGLTHDISATGFFLLTNERLPIATRIRLHLDPHPPGFGRVGVVTRHQIVPNELRSVLSNGMGVQFTADGAHAPCAARPHPPRIECLTTADRELLQKHLKAGFVMVRVDGAAWQLDGEASFEVHLADAAGSPAVPGNGRVVQLLSVDGVEHAVLEVRDAQSILAQVMARQAGVPGP